MRRFGSGRGVLGGGHVGSAADCLIEDRRVITAVKVNVRSDEKMVGEKFPTVSHDNIEQAAGLSPSACPVLVPRLQPRCQRETDRKQEDEYE
jgi:hypothetical protein